MDLVDQIKTTFAQARDPRNALAMRRYMRNRFEFLGLKRPQYRDIIRRLFAAHLRELEPAEITAVVRDLWAQPEREFQYVAIDLLARMTHRLPASALETIDKLLRHKAWWDSVDPLSSPLTAGLLQRYSELWTKIDEWALDKDFWVRRAAILVQRTYGEKTDVVRLSAYVRANVDDPEFFIQKAIGWALRSYAKTEEQSVRRLLAEIDLSPLAVREATRHMRSAKTDDK